MPVNAPKLCIVAAHHNFIGQIRVPLRTDLPTSALEFATGKFTVMPGGPLLEGKSKKELAKSSERFVLAASGKWRKHLPFLNDTEGHAVIIEMFKKAMPAEKIEPNTTALNVLSD